MAFRSTFADSSDITRGHSSDFEQLGATGCIHILIQTNYNTGVVVCMSVLHSSHYLIVTGLQGHLVHRPYLQWNLSSVERV